MADAIDVKKRCFSLDRTQSEQQRGNICSDRYISQNSPTSVIRRVPSTPEVYFRNYGGGESQRDDNHIQCIPFHDPDVYEFNLQNLPEELLDEFEEPSFHDLPPNASFDEVRCVLATPSPATKQSESTAAEKLKSLRAKVDEVVQIDNLRNRMAAHIRKSGEQPAGPVQVDDVRRRMAAMISQSKPQPPLCHYEIPPLPEDPYAIPPPPKNPKDVVAIIRRAQAIARLKALEEAKAPKSATKRRVKGDVASRKLSKYFSKEVRPTILPKIKVPRKAGLIIQKKTDTPQHPPDYVSDEWAAAIFRTRKLAGLKTTNPKLLLKAKTRSPTAKPATPKQSTPLAPTFEDIMKRVAAIRSRSDVTKGNIKEGNILSNIRSELKEYECSDMQQRVNDLQNRIDDMQQQILQTPTQSIPRSEAVMSPIELDEFEALEELYGASSHDQCTAADNIRSDLQDRINLLQQKLFQSPKMKEIAELSPIYEIPSILRYQNLLEDRESMAAAAAQASLIQRTQVSKESENEEKLNINDNEMSQTPLAYTTSQRAASRPRTPSPKRSRSPAVVSQVCPSGFDDAFLSDIDMPDFRITDIPDFAFSTEALENAGFDIRNELSLTDISMPFLDEDISFDELGLEDITSPDLCDLSISDTEMALEPDYNMEISTEEEQDNIAQLAVEEQMTKEPGFLTTMVNALVNRFKNIFSPSQIIDEQKKEDEDEINPDSSLPNLFEATPPTPKSKMPLSVNQTPSTPKEPFMIPPHPTNSKNYEAIVKRARAIEKKKAQEAALAQVAAIAAKKNMKKPLIKSSLPKRGPLQKKKYPVQKKVEKPEKIYPPGEYSPSYARAVARARSIAGLKNRSAILNPERAAKISKLKAAREAELAAIEALPPVERMRKKMEGKPSRVNASLSIETLATLEAIRANLPIPKPPKRKWHPAGRLRADHRTKPKERVFKKDFGRVLIPAKRTQKKKGWRELDVLSPLVEEPQFLEDFMQFSPLKPHECQMRLQYLREQAAKRTAETIKAAEVAQDAISVQTPPRHRTKSPNSTFGTPQKSAANFSPLQLESPSRPRTEETKREKVITKVGPNGGQETIREEVTETSTIKNGEVHTTTKHVTTKTDEFGNVTCHIQKGKGLSGEEEALLEDLSEEEPPDFMNTSDIPSPVDTSIPTPGEIIDRIRSKVQQKLKFSLPDLPKSPKTPSPIDFPENLPEEELFNIEMPEIERTPPRPSPQVRTFSPFEKDQRMYAWGETPQPTPPPTPKVSSSPPKLSKYISPRSQSKETQQKEICIPLHPKDPKDYKAMVKRAQAIQKLKNINEISAKAAFPKKPVSKWIGHAPKDPKRLKRKRLVLKKRIPKVSPSKDIVQQPEEEDNKDRVCPTKPLPPEYREAIARARLMRGLKNRTAALNPKVAAELAAFDSLSEHEKIMKRMEKVRKIPAKKRRIEASADILGTIAAIRASMPPVEDVLQQPSQYKAQTVKDLPVSTQATSPHTLLTAYPSDYLPEAVMRVHARSKSSSPDSHTEAMPASATVRTRKMDAVENVQNTSPSRFRIPSSVSNTANTLENISLEEFEKLEAKLKNEISLDEFEALEAELQNLYNYDTPQLGERHCGKKLVNEFPSSKISAPRNRSQKSRSVSPLQLDEQQSFIALCADASPSTIYYDEMQDFIIPPEHVELDSSQLMHQTPPKNIQERFKRLKEAQEKINICPGYFRQSKDFPTSPVVDFSPIRLISPSTAPCFKPDQRKQEISSNTSSPKTECLLNIDGSTERRVAPAKQFRDLEDMPFDELEYEIEPCLTNISFESPVSPPPKPSDIISRIRSNIQQQLKERAQTLTPTPLVMVPMPEDLPDEKLFELSAPSFALTPPQTPPAKYKSPRVSLPMAWGEVSPVTPETPEPTIPPHIPIKDPSPIVPEEHIKYTSQDNLSEGEIIIPPHPKNTKDYAAIVRRAKAIYKLKKQELKKAEEAAKTPPQKARVPISRWQGPSPKKVSAKPKRKLILRKCVQQPAKTLDKKKPSVLKEEETECLFELPVLSQEYRDAVARARLIHGLKNRTAALNPKIQAQTAAYNALPKHEKIKIRMERLRKKANRRQAVKPTMEQIAYLEALKDMKEYEYCPRKTTAKSLTPVRVSVTPRAKVYSYQRTLSPITLRAGSRQVTEAEPQELSESEVLEQFESASVRPSNITQYDAQRHRIYDLEEQLLKSKGLPEQEDVSLAEFEALEEKEAPFSVCQSQSSSALDLDKLISNLQQQQLATPPRKDPRERYKQLIAQRKTPKTPVVSPIKTPEISYSPITFSASPSREEVRERAEKSTTQITRSGNNTIKEQVFETSEIVNGDLQHFTTHVTTTTDPQGNVTCQINDSKRISARDRSDEYRITEDLEEVQEPSFFETTPTTPIERPRPRDLIEKVRRQVKESYRPEVPTGNLIELRTSPPMLPLPEDIPEEELLDFSCPAFESTPTQSNLRTPQSPAIIPDVSIPQLFTATPPMLTDLQPVSPIRHRIQSPEDPLVIPPHPKDPKDFKAICRRARKIQELIEKKEAKVLAVAEAEAASIAAKAAKLTKKKRVPISRWEAPPPRKPRTRKKLVMRKRDDAMATKTLANEKTQNPVEHEEVPPLPEHFAEEVALARRLAGIKTRSAAKETPLLPISDYATAMSRIKIMREKGALPRGQPSLASAAYLNAVKRAMQVRRQPLSEVSEYESPKKRYERILAERTVVPPKIIQSPLTTPSCDDISYSPVRFVSPRTEEDKFVLEKLTRQYNFNADAFENLNELEDLEELEEPSYLDVSQYYTASDLHMPLTPPQTPPPIPADIINKIRQQHKRQVSNCPESRPTTPTNIEFLDELPEEDLFELSEPSFAKSPIESETPIKSPNISIPHYFEASLNPAIPSPTPEINEASPPLACYGIKVKSPQAPVVVPPHPRDPSNVTAMVKRAQIIQKLLAKKAAEKTSDTKVNIPISRTAVAYLVQKARKPMRKLDIKKKAPYSKAKSVAALSSKEITAEQPELDTEYIAEVAKARRLGELKTKTTHLKPPDYATIVERVAALREKNARQHQGPSARELTHRQHLINRQQRQERRRLLLEMKKLRQQQVFDKSLDFEPTRTPPPARERLQAIKSRIQMETPTTSLYPYSPVETPEIIDLPEFQPIVLPTTPPFQHLKNVCIPDIENISMPFNDLNDNMDNEIDDLEDLEFKMAGAEAAYDAFIEYDENNNIAEWENTHEKDFCTIQQDFNINDRIEMLKSQLNETPNKASFSPEIMNEYNMTKRMEKLQNQLLQTPTRQQSPKIDARKDNVCMDISQFGENECELYDDQQALYDEMMDDFEEIERECQ